MSKLRTSITLISPSVMSAAGVLLLSAGFIAQKSWAYIHHKQLFYDFLFGDYGANTRWLARSGQSTLHERIFSNNVLYLVLLVICALFVGCLVYLLIRTLTALTQGSRVVLSEIHSTDRGSKAMLATFTARTLLRIVGALSWVIYTVLFVALLSPACIALSQKGIDQLSAAITIGGWACIIGATGLLAICLHVHIIFMRICFLRLRLFGGLDSDLYLSGH